MRNISSFGCGIATRSERYSNIAFKIAQGGGYWGPRIIIFQISLKRKRALSTETIRSVVRIPLPKPVFTDFVQEENMKFTEYLDFQLIYVDLKETKVNDCRKDFKNVKKESCWDIWIDKTYLGNTAVKNISYK